jgi:hypothetical protein
MNGSNGGNGTAPIRLLGVQAPAAAALGSGGDGAFVLAAPGGVFFTGTIELGNGRGIVYADFHAAGAIYGASLNAAYSAWANTSASDFFIRGGTGGGGAGGDGQLIIPNSLASPPPIAVFSLLGNAPSPVEGEPQVGGAPALSAMNETSKTPALEEPLFANASSVTSLASATAAKPSIALAGGIADPRSGGPLSALDVVFADILRH